MPKNNYQEEESEEYEANDCMEAEELEEKKNKTITKHVSYKKGSE